MLKAETATNKGRTWQAEEYMEWGEQLKKGHMFYTEKQTPQEKLRNFLITAAEFFKK